MTMFSVIGQGFVRAFQSFGDQIRNIFSVGAADRAPDPSPNFLERFAAFEFVGSIRWAVSSVGDAIGETYSRFADWLTGSPPQPVDPDLLTGSPPQPTTADPDSLKSMMREYSEYVVSHLDEKPWVRSPGSRKPEIQLRHDQSREYWQHVLDQYGYEILQLAAEVPRFQPNSVAGTDPPSGKPIEPTATLTDEDRVEGARIVSEAQNELHKEREAAARIEHQSPAPSKAAVEPPIDLESSDEQIPRQLTDDDRDAEHLELLNRVEKEIERRKALRGILKEPTISSDPPPAAKKVAFKNSNEVRLYHPDPVEKKIKSETMREIMQKTKKRKEVKKAKASEKKRKASKPARTRRDGSHHRVAGPALDRSQRQRGDDA